MSALEMDDIPADFPVRPIDPAALEYRTDPETGRTVWFRATCGECGLSWDDTIPTAYTPAPSARCPFEAFHEMDEPDPEIYGTWYTITREYNGAPNGPKFIVRRHARSYEGGFDTREALRSALALWILFETMAGLR